VRCERGLLSRADGSAQYSLGGTACLASVTGPVQAPASAREDPERATLEVVFKPRAGLAGGGRRGAAQHPCSALPRAGLSCLV
jgi:exosome complex component RRP46